MVALVLDGVKAMAKYGFLVVKVEEWSGHVDVLYVSQGVQLNVQGVQQSVQNVLDELNDYDLQKLVENLA